MAEGGFFFEPTEEKPDKVHCFYCDAELYEWEEGEDPLKEHVNCDCDWAHMVSTSKQGEEMEYWGKSIEVVGL